MYMYAIIDNRGDFYWVTNPHEANFWRRFSSEPSNSNEVKNWQKICEMWGIKLNYSCQMGLSDAKTRWFPCMAPKT